MDIWMIIRVANIMVVVIFVFYIRDVKSNVTLMATRYIMEIEDGKYCQLNDIDKLSYMADNIYATVPRFARLFITYSSIIFTIQSIYTKIRRQNKEEKCNGYGTNY